MDIINISAYKFVSLSEDELPALKETLLSQALQLNLKGTILLSTEGINVFFAGTHDDVDAFKQFLQDFPQFKDLPFKDSPSTARPFTRMLVRIKKEIISMGVAYSSLGDQAAPYVTASELKDWYDQGKDMVILDTRNDYEVSLGSFENALDLNIETFRAFPDAVKELPESMKDKTVVTFCTGGIRCEKAALHMKELGFNNVYQLDGGILKYFEQCGGEHYRGDCFVFDKRVCVDSQLEETDVEQCYACRMPLTVEEQTAQGTCPHCAGNAVTGEKAA